MVRSTRAGRGGFLRAEPIAFANVAGGSVDDPVSLADYINSQFDPALSWDDIAWFRSAWNGPIVLKGIQSVADARLAADAGVDAIALSNHGGRQLDGAPPPLELVAPVADAVGDRIEIICDGGVRRGSDIVKAIALGATACMVGRAYLYGLAAAGEPGVDWVIDHLHEGVRRTMGLIGAGDMEPTRPRTRALAWPIAPLAWPVAPVGTGGALDPLGRQNLMRPTDTHDANLLAPACCRLAGSASAAPACVPPESRAPMTDAAASRWFCQILRARRPRLASSTER